jgi:tetratricopeptide (TPR) repeat protein/GTPase SAR1 family protein
MVERAKRIDMGEQYRNISPLILFYSYAQEDEPLRKELEKHLSLLQRQGIITTWHNRQIVPGTNWADAIDSHLKEAAIIFLLISPDFLASDYCYSNEMELALKSHEQGLAYVIPILLRPVDWQGAPFSHLQPLPSNKKFVTQWESQDAAFLDIASSIRTTISNIHGPVMQSIPRPSIFIDRQSRQRLLKRVRAFWIQGLLEQSLHQAALVALGLRHQPDALANPWSLIVQEVEQIAQPLPAGTYITQVYDDADGALLILGEPGSGKTTLLLELAHDLLERAEQDETYPMPVVFNLSSWAVKRQPLADWLTEELNLRYQVPPQLARSWVSAERILPLLDGLDEVTPSHFADCVEAINVYRGEHDFASLVVCSRNEEYFSQKLRILLHYAVTVQPLTIQQIDEYLRNAGEQLIALRTTIHEDEVLLKLATNPLMLSVLALTYRGKTVEELNTIGSPQVRRRQIFAAYVQRMFEHRGVVVSYDPQRTVHWLQELASQMVLHNQTEFYLESIQPDWLWQKSLRQCYEWLCGRHIFEGLIHALYSLLLTVLVIIILISILPVVINNGWFGILIAIFPGGVLISIVSGILHGWRKGLYTAIVGILVGGVVGALISKVLTDLSRPQIGLVISSVTGLMTGLFSSIISREERMDTRITIRLVFVLSWRELRRSLKWSWKEVGRSFKGEYKETLAISVVCSVASILIGVLIAVKKDIFSGLCIGGIALSSILLFGNLIHGVQEEPPSERNKSLSKRVLSTPNQGIHRSARQGLYGSLAGGLGGFLCIWLLISHSVVITEGICWLEEVRCYATTSDVVQPTMELLYGLIAGVLLGGLACGWDVCVRHFTLRALLWRAGSFPMNAAHFLDYAVERILLRKIGGSYIFVHRLLLEYFALLMMETETTQKTNLGTKDATIYHNRGLIFAEFNEDEQAIRNYTRAIELRSKEASVYRDRGKVYARRKEHQQALADYTCAIDLDPKNAWTYRWRGQTYRLLERYEEALADFNRAIALEANNAWTYRWRGVTYRLLERYEKALADFNRAIALEANNIWAYRWRGQTYRLLERYEEALADFNRAIDLEANDDETYYQRGVTYRLLERYEEALADFNRAIALEANDAWTYRWRGVTYRLLERYEEALADFDRAIALKANDDWYRYCRAQLYSLTGQTQAFSNDIHAAIELAQGVLRARADQTTTEMYRVRFNITLYLLFGNNETEAEALYHELLSTCSYTVNLQSVKADLDDLLTIQPNNPIVPRLKSLLQTRLESLKP